MQQYLRNVGRQVAVINLDPANDALPYEAAVDISDLVHLEAVMAELKLGPNGGLIYCMEYLEQNMDWLQERLEPLAKGACMRMAPVAWGASSRTYVSLKNLQSHIHSFIYTR